MGKNVEPISANADLAAILVKGMSDPGSLSPPEKLRLSSVLVASFRRMESVYVQNKLGSIDDDLQAGFELSMVTLLATPFGSEWWNEAKITFYGPFVAHMDKRIQSGELLASHPSMLYDDQDAS